MLPHPIFVITSGKPGDRNAGDGNPGTDGTFSDFGGQTERSWYCVRMPRLSDIAVVNLAPHVTQRGNARQVIFANEEERGVYLNLLRKYVNYTYGAIYTNNSLVTTVRCQRI